MRSRITLRQLKADAAATLANANEAIDKGELSIVEINNLIGLAVGLVNTTADFVEDLADGIEFEIKINKTGVGFIDRIIEGWNGKIPIVIRMDPREENNG